MKGALLGCASLIAIIGVHESARAQDAGTPIPDVSVNAQQVQRNDGSAAAGYREENVYGGIGSFWGDLPTQDVPYSVQLTPAELVKNLNQVTNLQDALKYNPDIQYGGGFGDGFVPGATYVIRGVYAGTGSLTTDNLYSPFGLAAPPEDKESINVLTGVSGFLYGVQSVSGHIDSQLKRPTATPLFDIIGGTNTGHNGYVHLDMGGPIVIPGLDPTVFGYRLNLMDQGGGTYIHNYSINRNLASLALDMHLPDNLLVQFNASHTQYRTWGNIPVYLTGGLSDVPPPNPLQQYSLPSGKYFTQDDTGGIKITWKPNDIFTLRTQYSYDMVRSGTDDSGISTEYKFLTGATVYPAGNIFGLDYQQYTHAGYSYLDTEFDIFSTHHKATTGFNGYWTETGLGSTYFHQPLFNDTGQTCSLYNEAACIAQNPNAANNRALSYFYDIGGLQNMTFQKNYMIGDEMKAWDDRIIVLAGVNYASDGTKAFDTFNHVTLKPVAQTPSNNAAALTPTASITYKILPWLSSYVSYQEALVPGAFVPATDSLGRPYTNANALIPPYQSSAWEGGVKATVGNNLLLSMALYDLTNPSSYTVVNGDGTVTERFGAASETKGIEVKAVGKLYDDLTLFGGISLNDARYKSAPGETYLANQQVVAQSPVTMTMYAEYNIPFFAEVPWAHNLTLTGGLRYFGPQKIGTYGASDVASYATTSIQGYAVGDLGFRYVYDLDGHPTTFRFTVTNVTNNHYWYAGGSNGDGGVVGQGRVFAATTEFKW